MCEVSLGSTLLQVEHGLSAREGLRHRRISTLFRDAYSGLVVEYAGKSSTGATIVPIICSSDIANLKNISGDKKRCLIYMTIENNMGKVSSKPSAKVHLLIELLSIPLKIIADATSKGRLQSWAVETLRSIMSIIL